MNTVKYFILSIFLIYLIGCGENAIEQKNEIYGNISYVRPPHPDFNEHVDYIEWANLLLMKDKAKDTETIYNDFLKLYSPQSLGQN